MRDQRKKGARLKIEGGSSLIGTCSVSTSKNAILPILAATLLTTEPVTIRRVPAISDVAHMIHLLKTFGAAVEQDGDTLTVTAAMVKTTSPNEKPRAAAARIFFVYGAAAGTGRLRNDARCLAAAVLARARSTCILRDLHTGRPVGYGIRQGDYLG